MSEIIRNDYIDELKKWKYDHFIKVITGVRRSGKSTILQQYIKTLEHLNIESKWIQYYDFNVLDPNDFNWKSLKDKIIQNSDETKINYIFLDEVQDIPDFEKCVISLFENKEIKFDIYITGSNSKMFSKALATLFTGRSIEIRVYPLSFKEYYEYHESINTKLKTTEIFSKYMKYGGLPVLLGVVNNDDKMEKVLQKVFDDSVQVDIEQRHMIRTEFFYKIAEYIFLQVGQPISVNNIANFLKSNNNSKTNFKTIMRYIEWMEEAILLYKCNFMVTKTKNVLQTSGKFYACDTGIRNSECKWQIQNRGYLLENIIYLQLLRKGYKVFSGKMWNNKEIDFIASKKNIELYIQVTEKIDWDKNSNNYKREIGNLESIRNSHLKVVFSLFDESSITSNGIRIVNVVEWLMEKIPLMEKIE